MIDIYLEILNPFNKIITQNGAFDFNLSTQPPILKLH